ncbi:putative TOB3 [Rosellinia necatrix]|uniref:Putative TOB3 n=1 Tax=Rosellinia necatrix TaxID=77044 RepID=A0A1W2TN43_ROSNE|nr:putative TOB3 [Rosellinia necatrix]
MVSSGKHPRPATRSSSASEWESDPNPPHKRQRVRHRPTMTIDWREEICRFLSRSSELSDEEILDELDTALAELVELRRLSSSQLAQPKPPDFQVINRVRCQDSDDDELYLDLPWVVDSGPYKAHLRGSNKIHNFELHLERNKEMTFFVFREFECCVPRSMDSSLRQGTSSDLQAEDLLVKEYISNMSNELRRALIELCNLALGETAHPNFIDKEVDQIHHPYLWWFRARSSIEETEAQINPDLQLHLNIFQHYLNTCLGDEWATVDQLLSTGYITDAYTHYLFAPQEICISNAQGRSKSLLEAFTAEEWLDIPSRSILGTKWTFDGNFEKRQMRFGLNKPPSLTRKFPVRELSIYPARFADEGDIIAIRERGKMFWKCRRRNYVCYKGAEFEGAYNMSDLRFMVDTATFKQMHPPNEEENVLPNHDDLGSEIMSQDEPDLSDNFFMCLPTTLSGFNMQKKEWVTLRVGFIEDVTWNEEAFKLLVIDESTKELIQAVVTNQLQAEDHTDMIRGKGNGLFILLHGGPGTGKTLTAESVAEIAQKPLYKVTCGDIGTKAEEVEKYLEVVLLLGKTWGCVVLLDEADVFLEQRSLSNLERNALVSVFLRVLEYYEGILILTSNRVGTFDEAFRSRIQLTLRYENLNQNQRHKIWENFVRRLEKLESSRMAIASSTSPARVISGFGIDFNDIKAHIAELSERKLNGREIRNAISTARQLAMYKREPMNYKHLERVIGETSKFEAYITELNRGFSSDEISKDKGERL